MSDDALIRRNNLRALRQDAEQLSQQVGGRKSYWYGMLDGSRPFGERIARKIEESYNLPRGQLDVPDSVSAESAPADLAAQKARKPAGAALQGLVDMPPLSKRAMILAMMFDDIKTDEEKERAYIQCQQIMLGFDPLRSPHEGSPSAAPLKVK